jgi:hypothetical protein
MCGDVSTNNNNQTKYTVEGLFTGGTSSKEEYIRNKQGLHHHGQELDCATSHRTRRRGTAPDSTTIIVPQQAAASATAPTATTDYHHHHHHDDDIALLLLLPTILEGILSLLLLYGGLVPSAGGRPLGHRGVSVILVQQRRL